MGCIDLGDQVGIHLGIGSRYLTGVILAAQGKSDLLFAHCIRIAYHGAIGRVEALSFCLQAVAHHFSSIRIDQFLLQKYDFSRNEPSVVLGGGGLTGSAIGKPSVTHEFDVSCFTVQHKFDPSIRIGRIGHLAGSCIFLNEQILRTVYGCINVKHIVTVQIGFCPEFDHNIGQRYDLAEIEDTFRDLCTGFLRGPTGGGIAI